MFFRFAIHLSAASPDVPRGIKCPSDDRAPARHRHSRQATILVLMRRTKQIGSPQGAATDDNAAMTEFVRALAEIAVVDYTSEQLFADDALSGCLQLILAKNEVLDQFGGKPWPEGLLTQEARSHLGRLRAAKLN